MLHFPSHWTPPKKKKWPKRYRPEQRIGVKDRLRENEDKPCEAPNCFRRRAGFRRYCDAHWQKWRRYGTVAPGARVVTWKEVRENYREALWFIKRSPKGQRSLAQLKDWFDEWKARAGHRRVIGGAAVRLWRAKKVKGRDVLCTFIAFYLYARLNPNVLEYGRPLWIAVGRRLCTAYGSTVRGNTYTSHDYKIWRSTGEAVARRVARLALEIVTAMDVDKNVRRHIPSFKRNPKP
jgi:hypothetical protein